MGSCRLLLLLLLVTLLLMVTAQGPGGTSGGRRQRPLQSQILGVRRIRFTRRPPGALPSTTPNTPVGAGVDSPVRAGAPGGDDTTVTEDPTRAGSADAEVDVDDGGPEVGTTQEQLDRHWTYRRMLLQRERERLLQHLPAAVDTIPFPGAPEVTGHDDDDAARSNDTDRKRNCTEYTVTEGTVRLCDEVHLMNSTDPSTTTGSVMSAAEVEMEARRAAMESPPMGQMSGQDWIERERYKQARLFMIQAMILQKLGFRRQPHVEDLDLSDNQRSQIMHAFRMYESEIGGGPLDDEGNYIRSLGLLTPSCDLPRNTNRVWRDGSRFRLYFQVQPPAWTETKISSASLRIYKRAMQNCDDCYSRPREIPEPLVERQGRRRRHKRTQDMPQGIPDFRSMIQPLSVDSGREVLELSEDTVQIVVYSYTKSVKTRRKEKVQEVVSVVVRRDYEGWLKLDIKNAVVDWYSGAPQKNFGLLVRVLDHNHRELYPFSILTPTNCTLNSNFSLPYPLSVADGQDTFNATDVNGNQTTPYLDLVTLGTQRYNAVIRRRRRNAAIAGAFSTKKYTSRNRGQQPFQRANLSTLLQWLGEKIMQSKLRIALHRSKRSYSQ